MLSKEEYEKAKKEISDFERFLTLTNRRIDALLDELYKEIKAKNTYTDSITERKNEIMKYEAYEEVKNII